MAVEADQPMKKLPLYVILIQTPHLTIGAAFSPTASRLRLRLNALIMPSLLVRLSPVLGDQKICIIHTRKDPAK
jgi:hypothetical protein